VAVNATQTMSAELLEWFRGACNPHGVDRARERREAPVWFVD
jgi:hypothetical protein